MKTRETSSGGKRGELFPLGVSVALVIRVVLLAAASDVDDIFSPIGSILSAKNEKEKENEAVTRSPREVEKCGDYHESHCARRGCIRSGAPSLFSAPSSTLRYVPMRVLEATHQHSLLPSL